MQYHRALPEHAEQGGGDVPPLLPSDFAQVSVEAEHAAVRLLLHVYRQCRELQRIWQSYH